MANELQDLPEASKLMGSFPKAPKGYVGPQELAPALQEINVKEAETKEELGKSDIRLEKAKKEEAATAAELKKAFYEGEKEKELAMPERAAAKAAREDLAAAKFEPTKDTVQDIAGLFSLMGVVGMVIGKKNALQGMYAMNGMMEGHIKGRKDLFTREAAEFDKQFKILQAKVESATKELEEARKLRIYDQKAGEEALAVAIARTESPLIKEMTARLGIEKTINVLNQTKETVTKMAGLQNDLKDKAEQRAIRNRELSLREKFYDLKEKKMNDTGDIPKDAKTKEEYRARYEIVKNIDDIQSLLTNPKYSKLITPVTKFTPELISNLRESYPELSQKLARIQAIEFQIGGKSLTKTEQAILSPIYEWKGLTADALKSKLSGIKDNLQETNALTEEFYPGLKRVHQRFDEAYKKLGKVPSAIVEDSGTQTQRPANAPADAKQAPDGNWYSPDPARPGKYLKW
jgi:hypothetical protein